MNKIAHQLATQELVRKKFRGHKRRICKSPPHYPMTAQREYQRVTNAYMKILKEVLIEYLPDIKQEAKIEKTRHDSLDDVLAVVQRAFTAMSIELERRAELFELRLKLEALSKLTRKLTIKEWKRMVKATLGIDLFEDYYLGEIYRENMNLWVDKNVELISTIPKDSLRKMKDIVMEGYRSGITTTAIMKQIQKTYGQSKRKAKFVARDQVAKLNADITEAQQRDAGVNEYVWSDSGDGRVRNSHKALDGKRFRWDDPPIVDVKTGRRCHPGRDYGCRCVALPVFDFDTINLPYNDSK